MKRNIYQSPQVFYDEFAVNELLCDSYNTEIDDYDYVDVDWNINS